MAQSKPVRYAALDLEASGENMFKHQTLSLAFAIFNSETGNLEDTFQVYIKPPRVAVPNYDTGDMAESFKDGEIVWEERCLTEFWHRTPEMRAVQQKLIEKVNTVGVHRKEAATALYKWVRENRTPEFLESLVFYSDTNGFDVGRVNFLLNEAGFMGLEYITGGYKPVFDSTSFHRGVGLKLPSDGYWGAEDAAYKNLKVDRPQNPFGATHDSLDDAKSIGWDIVQIHRAIEQKRNTGL
jgi:hypothetical protein